MIYTQLFNLLCDKADDQYGGKLPVHVRCLIDECANIGQIPQLEKLVSTGCIFSACILSVRSISSQEANLQVFNSINCVLLTVIL